MIDTEMPGVRRAVDWNKWMTIVQVVAVCVSTIGLYLVWWQLRLSTEATEALVAQSLAAQSGESLKVAMDNPTATRILFPVFGPATAKAGADDVLKAQLLSRALLCHFEAILAQESHMSEEQRVGFRQFIAFMFSASPMLHETLEESPKDFYTPKLQQIAQENPTRPVQTGR